jgi:peptide chain release factor 3
MEVTHVQSGKTLRLSRPQRVFASERETIESAFPGDIIGIPNFGYLLLGDTLGTSPKVAYDEVPAFSPEIFAAMSNADPSRFKHFDKGVEQLAAEGLIDLFHDPRSEAKHYVLGAVGMLQFDVVKFRMEGEYGVRTEMMPLSQRLIRWVEDKDNELGNIYIANDVRQLLDANGNKVLLFNTEFQVNFLEGKLKTAKLLKERIR